MIAALSRLIDRSAMYLAAARMPRPDGRDFRLAEAQKVIDSLDFIPAEVKVADVQFTEGVGFRFDTPQPGPFAQNNTVHGRFYRSPGPWLERPTAILLHGWNDAIHHHIRFPHLAAQFNRNGLNAVTLEAPFHFQRRPRQLGAWSNFLCPDIFRTVEAMRQEISEIRAFAGWLRRQGCPAVGLVGVSLGVLMAGLTVCHDARFSCAVLLVPVARLDRMLEEAPFCRHIRLAWNGRPVEAGKLNLTEVRPVIPLQNILLIEGIHDLFVRAETMEELWRAWDKPEIWRLRQGHISVLAAPGLHGRIIDWMAPRLRGEVAK
jgi:dienelactone hydrolase